MSRYNYGWFLLAALILGFVVMLIVMNTEKTKRHGWVNEEVAKNCERIGTTNIAGSKWSHFHTVYRCEGNDADDKN